MLKFNEVNPLNVHGLRQLHHCPPHFEQITIDLPEFATSRKKTMIDWVYENLEGRFYIKEINSTRGKLTIGFEVKSEASYFILSMANI